MRIFEEMIFHVCDIISKVKMEKSNYCRFDNVRNHDVGMHG